MLAGKATGNNLCVCAQAIYNVRLDAPRVEARWPLCKSQLMNHFHRGGMTEEPFLFGGKPRC